MRGGVHDDHLLALLLQHRHGLASRQDRGDDRTRTGPGGAQHQIAGEGNPDDGDNGRGRHRQQEALELRRVPPAGIPPPVI